MNLHLLGRNDSKTKTKIGGSDRDVSLKIMGIFPLENFNIFSILFYLYISFYVNSVIYAYTTHLRNRKTLIIA